MTEPPIHLMALSGSLREGSANTALLHAARLLAPAGVTVTVYDRLGQLPLFCPDLEGELPSEAARLRAALCASDGILIASPEYAHGVPGAFKNALDWVVGCAELGPKPVALLNASDRAVHAQAALAEIIVTMNLDLVPEASLVIPVAGKRLDAQAIAAHADYAPLVCKALAVLIARGTDKE